MHLPLRAVLASVGAVLVTTLLTPQGAGAEESPTITVTPSTGLEDEQAVAVTGAGFDPAASRWAGTVCLTEVLDLLPSASQEINEICGAESLVEVAPNPAGEFSTTLVVHQVQRVFVGGGTIDCRESGCVVSFIQLVGPGQELTGWATTPIRFGPAVPESTAQCKKGGWRDLATEQRRPFRNQGQCVSFVVAHRR